ncbi:3-ketoacyl-CoA synthase 1 [Hibiscus syriacus]|uniref:3-ketoacyl-CoA synthase 1 n=1 Tax=Hibiscus syriacus TaxID=106335 RepID=A0A6A3A5M6_HIBSY|nr:3-ketoacyl-CoA synthase 1 [Hibiscus syriacus]
MSMWTTSLVPYLSMRTKYPPPTDFPINVSASCRLRRQAAASNPKQDDGKAISGSDVLWALQRAAAQKKKANRKKKGLTSSPDSQREKDSIDYSDVRPFEIKSEWSPKLDELEKRLQQLQEEDTV